MSTKMRQLYMAIDQHDSALARLNRQVKETLPIGTPVEWETTRLGKQYRHSGTVEGHRGEFSRYPGEIMVENDRTGKTSWVSISQEGFSAFGVTAP